MESTTPYAPADSTGIHGTYNQLPNSLYLSQHPAPLPHEAPSAGFDFLPPHPFSSHLSAPVSIASTSQHPVPSTASVFVLPAQKVPPSTSRPSSASLSQTNGFPPFAYDAAEPQIYTSVAPAGAPVEAPYDAPVASIVAHASIRRAMQNALPTPLTYRPARGSTVHSTRMVDDVPQIGSAKTCSRSTSRAAGEPDERMVMPTRCKVNRNSQKEINSLEVTVQCATCPSQRTLARLVLRALPDSLVAALEGGSAPLDVLRIAGSRALPVAPLSADSGGASCWTCMGLQEGDAGVLRAGAQSHRQEAASPPQGSYDATLSAAIDRFEALQLGEEQGLDDKPRTRPAEPSGMSGDGYESLLLADESLVSEQYLGENDSLLKCDVCGFLCGIGSIFEVLAVPDIPAGQLDYYEARSRALYFNCRLSVIARPEFLLSGDGLARNFDEVWRVSTDHWAQLAQLLRNPPAEGSNIKRYLTSMYSIPRRRHLRRGKNKAESARAFDDSPAQQVAFGFSIAEANLDLGTLQFCCAMPWPNNGQAFDAVTMLGEETTRRVKADLALLNHQRASLSPPLPPLPALTYNYIGSPFRHDSRQHASVSRRGYETFETLQLRDPFIQRDWFRIRWLPDEYASALTVYIRRLESEEDMGGPPPQNVPRKRTRKSTTVTTDTPDSASPVSVGGPSFEQRQIAPAALVPASEMTYLISIAHTGALFQPHVQPQSVYLPIPPYPPPPP
ncbi:hypothetical protein Rhopal_005958-T1 [Rhodotorula paludigena]|uniref:Uncharacterized protein n=1 Tax=Rhodotorula paludigena TaxID=86838 RepID=A0AAV5GKR1_9BASI|nr:hypothetical protein Rhopal_005958-T1 [Rhodotorula paludigena]